MTTTERDALLSKLARLPLAMIGHTGTSVAIEQLAEVVRAIVEGLVVEEETPKLVDRGDGALVFPPQPDFAAMAEELLELAALRTPIDVHGTPSGRVARWLRANAHRFASLASPPPAPVVRNEAWWRMQAQRVLVAANPKVNAAGDGADADLPKAAALLRSTFAAPVALSRETALLLFAGIEHGDTEHRAWLKAALLEFAETGKVTRNRPNPVAAPVAFDVDTFDKAIDARMRLPPFNLRDTERNELLSAIRAIAKEMGVR